MYAIIKTGGKQYKVSEGDILKVDRLSKEKDSEVEFDVVAINTGEDMIVGNEVADKKVQAKVIDEGKDKKVIIYKKRRRKDSKLKKGFRREFTKVKITKIA